ncbi:NrfD/PsrC family molybdoenzyme membrane anchor subunit [Bacillaceae bacterium S4-13-56]
MPLKRMINAWTVTLGILSLLGIGAWIYQLTQGLVVTGMNNIVSWGLYITGFMFFVGLSAGGLIVSSSATVFNIKQFKAIAKPAVLLSTVCIIAAALLIVVDLGSPERILNLFIHPEFNSPLIWDVFIITIYLGISLFYLYHMTRPNPNEKAIKILSSIALPVAVLVHSVTAWIFGLQIARPTWHSALMAPLFVSSALASGLALLLVVIVALNKFRLFEVKKTLISTLAGLLCVFIAVDVFFVFSEVLTALFPAEERLMAYTNQMLTGSLAPFFWGEVILGAFIPFMILIFRKNRENMTLIVLASALVVIGVFFKRVWLLFSSLLLPLLDYAPGVTLGKYNLPDSFQTGREVVPNIWATLGSYTPSWVEISIIIGVLALITLIYTLGSYVLFVPKNKEHSTNKGGEGHATQSHAY